ncbi:hypothetical protein ES708_25250 [subsurface metagenome]
MAKKKKVDIPQEHLMTIEEVAEYLKLNVHTVYKLAQRGEIPAIKLGGSWRLRKQEIYSWLATKMTMEKKARYEKWQKKYKKLMKDKP